jgi:hypothetical protein
VGNFKNAGWAWRPKGRPNKFRCMTFSSRNWARRSAIPYFVYGNKRVQGGLKLCEKNPGGSVCSTATCIAKRVESVANATLGASGPARWAVSTIGHGLALARGLTSKHAIKQVDRLLSNEGIDIAAALRHWVPYVVGCRTSINIAIACPREGGGLALMLSLLTRHGRATPLLWLTVDTSTLKNRRNEYEYQALVRLADPLPADIKVSIVADRGFGDHKLYQVLTEELKFDYVIRFRGNIQVTAADGEMRTAAAWVGRGGRARVLRDALVTAERYQVCSVLCVQDKAMKQTRCLATKAPNKPSRP